MPSLVSQVPAADSASAIRRFESAFSFETDCWDVHAALAHGPDFVLIDVRSPELFANAHYDLAVMEVHRALDARLRRVLLGRKSNLPDGDLDALVAAAKRAGILREPALTLFKDLDRQWHIALSSEPLTKEGAAVALSATRHILATIPVPEPVAAGSGKTV